MGLSPHPLLITEARSKRKQIMFFHTWNMLTATFSLTCCCKMSSLFISGLVVIFGIPCWLVIKILSLSGKVNRVVLRNPINYKRFTRCSGIASAFGLHIIALSFGLPNLNYTSATLFMIEHSRTCYRSNLIPG